MNKFKNVRDLLLLTHTNNAICDGLKGLCVLLSGTSYPCRYSDIIPRFPRPVSVLSLISNEILDFIYRNHSHLVTD